MHKNPFNDEYFMQMALYQANIALDEGEVPVGAVIVCDNKIIAKGYNQTQKLNDVTAHAEILAITSAANKLGAKYLKNCTLYVTLEPCVMCAGALSWTQIDRIVVGANDPKKGFLKQTTNLLHPKTQLTKNVLSTECEAILNSFFTKLRT